jgi:ribosomal protein S18 acetylase RimI-like enzyme
MEPTATLAPFAADEGVDGTAETEPQERTAGATPASAPPRGRRVRAAGEDRATRAAAENRAGSPADNADEACGCGRIRLRLARAENPRDVAAVRRLVNAAFAEHRASGANLVGIDQDDEATRRRMAGREVWLAYDGRRLLATVSLGITPDESAPDAPPTAEITQFAVRPECKGRGLGSHLLRHAEESARRSGAAEVRLSTAEPIPHLFAFYTRRGYRPVGRIRHPGRTYDSIVMAKVL